jgi:hypothetical protein
LEIKVALGLKPPGPTVGIERVPTPIREEANVIENTPEIAELTNALPIVAIVLGIGMLALWFDCRKKRVFFEWHHKERMAAIEKGMEVACDE